uniref:Uncharacterized protein n=1 Tax=Mesocestoides corti TaxID=53468 RepID=A0A5K3FCM4_MESCO
MFTILDVAAVEYLSPNMKKTGTTEQALLTSHKPEPQVRSLPSLTRAIRSTHTTLASHSYPSLVGSLSSSHVIGTQIDTELAEASVKYVCVV